MELDNFLNGLKEEADGSSGVDSSKGMKAKIALGSEFAELKDILRTKLKNKKIDPMLFKDVYEALRKGTVVKLVNTLFDIIISSRARIRSK